MGIARFIRCCIDASSRVKLAGLIRPASVHRHPLKQGIHEQNGQFGVADGFNDELRGALAHVLIENIRQRAQRRSDLGRTGGLDQAAANVDGVLVSPGFKRG